MHSVESCHEVYISSSVDLHVICFPSTSPDLPLQLTIYLDNNIGHTHTYKHALEVPELLFLFLCVCVCNCVLNIKVSVLV